MSLRIPLGDQTLQVEFHEIERRLRKLEKVTGVSVASTVRIVNTGGGGGGAVNLQAIYDRLNALEDAIANLPEPITSDFGGVGQSSTHGLVPAPGVALPPTGLAGHVLVEDGEWGFPFRGLLQVTSPGDATEAADNLNLLGSLGLAGDLSADEVDCRRVTTLDGVTLSGDAYQVTSFQRGLVPAVTDGTQTQPPYDVVDINAGLHVQSVTAATIEVGDLHVYGELDLDGGVP